MVAKRLICSGPASVISTSPDLTTNHPRVNEGTSMAEQQSTVEYRDIPGFPGYRVGDDGSVWSSRTMGRRKQFGLWHPAKLHRRPYGARYFVVCLRAEPGGKLSCRYVHRLVLEAFVGPCPGGLVACHGTGDTSDNSAANLRWDTQKANIADRRRHGTAPDMHCRRGHEYTGDNLLVEKNGSRRCKECRRIGRRAS